MKLSVSLPGEDVDFLDAYARERGLESRSAAVQQAWEDATLLAIKAEMHDLEHRLGDASVPEPEHEAMLGRYAELQDRFRLADGYTIGECAGWIDAQQSRLSTLDSVAAGPLALDAQTGEWTYTLANDQTLSAIARGSSTMRQR